MIIIRTKILPCGTFVAMTVGPFIFVKSEEVDGRTLRHEGIHWEQYKETGIIGFLLLYVLDYVWEALRCILDHRRGTRADGRYRSLRDRIYRCVMFEREAYAHDDEEDYIKNRRHYAWLKQEIV